jgi:hypothetical protein
VDTSLSFAARLFLITLLAGLTAHPISTQLTTSDRPLFGMDRFTSLTTYPIPISRLVGSGIGGVRWGNT